MFSRVSYACLLPHTSFTCAVLFAAADRVAACPQRSHVPCVGCGGLPPWHILCERRRRPDCTHVVHRDSAATAHLQR